MFVFPDTGLLFFFHVAVSSSRHVASDCERYSGILLKKSQILLADFCANSFSLVVEIAENQPCLHSGYASYHWYNVMNPLE